MAREGACVHPEERRRGYVPGFVRRLYHAVMRPLRRRSVREHDVPVEAGMLAVPIERPGAAPVSDLRSRETWLDHSFGDGREDARPVLLNELYALEHERAYGQPWLFGRTVFEMLRAEGVLPGQRVLDVGCGAGRVGVWLAAYLEPGRYFGVDPHLRGLVAFSTYEARLHGLAERRPRLMLDGEFRFDAFGVRFDAALDINVSRHLPADRVRALYGRLRECLEPGGRVYSLGLDEEHLAVARGAGFEVVKSLDVPDPLPRTREKFQAARTWHVLRAPGPAAQSETVTRM